MVRRRRRRWLGLRPVWPLFVQMLSWLFPSFALVLLQGAFLASTSPAARPGLPQIRFCGTNPRRREMHERAPAHGHNSGRRCRSPLIPDARPPIPTVRGPPHRPAPHSGGHPIGTPAAPTSRDPSRATDSGEDEEMTDRVQANDAADGTTNGQARRRAFPTGPGHHARATSTPAQQGSSTTGAADTSRPMPCWRTTSACCSIADSRR